MELELSNHPKESIRMKILLVLIHKKIKVMGSLNFLFHYLPYLYTYPRVLCLHTSNLPLFLSSSRCFPQFLREKQTGKTRKRCALSTSVNKPLGEYEA